VTISGDQPVLDLVKDYNGDNWSDLLLQSPDGTLGVHFLRGTELQTAALLNPDNVGDLGWRIAATGQFGGDARPDIVFQHTDGTLAAWIMNGSRLSTAAFISPSNPGDPNWIVRGAADVHGDGGTDLLFQHTDGTLAVWHMNGLNLESASLLNPSHPGDSNWRLAGAGRLNGDNKSDLVFQHTDGSLAAWYMDGVNLIQGTLLNPSHPGDANWWLAGTADFNRDGKSDLVFQNRSDSQLASWIMDGITLSEGKLMSFPGAGWKVSAP
jgi:hypothetical protein